LYCFLTIFAPDSYVSYLRAINAAFTAANIEQLFCINPLKTTKKWRFFEFFL